ncbi:MULTISPECIES: LysR family substrate-binding domain-containing protein [Rhodococcus]|uniref:LysR family substrate-binding domain-containing protein n=1 Tax=Rhodococcus TaxID=1827 RepID=UPI001EF00143|nr:MULTISPECIES: LysR family substrate-binding domain-containing protein [Rhodococcus]
MFGSSGITGRASLGFASVSSRRVLPLITRAVKGSEPGIDLALQGQTYGGAVVNQTLSGSLDMGLARLPVRDPSIDWHIIDFETLVAALPEDHPLAAKPELEVADLAGEPFVTFPGTLGSTVRDATALIALQAGFSPRIVQEAPDSYTILSLVAAGVGITVTVSSVQHIQMPGTLLSGVFHTGTENGRCAGMAQEEHGSCPARCRGHCPGAPAHTRARAGTPHPVTRRCPERAGSAPTGLTEVPVPLGFLSFPSTYLRIGQSPLSNS